MCTHKPRSCKMDKTKFHAIALLMLIFCLQQHCFHYNKNPKTTAEILKKSAKLYSLFLDRTTLSVRKTKNLLCISFSSPPKKTFFGFQYSSRIFKQTKIWSHVLNLKKKHCTVGCFPRFCFVVKTSADNVILQIFDIFSHEFSLFSTHLSF